jgi:hypothetical protein
MSAHSYQSNFEIIEDEEEYLGVDLEEGSEEEGIDIKELEGRAR